MMTSEATCILPRGPVMMGLAGYTLSTLEIQQLRHPAVGGVILFRRNYENREQLKLLISHIKVLRTPELIVAVDHEGGRVQRFIEGFTRLPAMRTLGQLWAQKGEMVAVQVAQQVSKVLALELRAVGVDFSFAPVLDLDWGNSSIIGNRSFHASPKIVSTLASAVQRGLLLGGMKSCGKHFPGHGFVAADSHHTLPEDTRVFDVIRDNDLLPFARLIDEGMASVMPAHVLYSAVDSQPAGYSSYWLQSVLRDSLKFEGMVFSDDLGMEGAGGAGSVVARAELAWRAGCDVVLVCNKANWLAELLGHPIEIKEHLAQRWQALEPLNDARECENYCQTADFKALALQVAAWSHEQDATGVVVGEAY